jgi:predicted glycogen debranching enzyme
MVNVIRITRDENPVDDARREWLVTNGLGGFASATISGEITRRHHGFLIAALPAPLGRIVMLNDLECEIERANRTTANVHEGQFVGFTMEMGLPSWRYEIDGLTLDKSVVMPARHNTVHITFRLIGAERSVRLRLRPFINFRRLEALVNEPLALGYALTAQGDRYEVTAGPNLPILRMIIIGCNGATFTADGGSQREGLFATEAQRGYEARGLVWSPGYFTAELRPDCAVTLVAAAEPWHITLALRPEIAHAFEIERRRRLVAMAPPKARTGLAAELVLAADNFIITPVGRIADIARAHAEGDEVRTIIAGYHWFTDWGPRYDDLA